MASSIPANWILNDHDGPDPRPCNRISQREGLVLAPIVVHGAFDGSWAKTQPLGTEELQTLVTCTDWLARQTEAAAKINVPHSNGNFIILTSRA
jgi:hypothetical protein